MTYLLFLSLSNLIALLMSIRNQRCRPLLNTNIILFISIIIICLQTTQTLAKNIQDINWDSLQFSCKSEQNPPFDVESDVWFQRARALEKADDENNDAEMIRLYQQASERGHYKAMLNLAILYAHGRSIKTNRRKAVDLVEKAMKMQSAHAYYLMGIMLEQGVGVKPDKIAALSYFRKSADMGNKYGQYATGEAIRDAVVKEEESIRQRGYAIAVQMLECSLSQGYVEAAYLLGRHYRTFDKNPERELFYFQKAAALGHLESLYSLITIFKNGKHPIEKNLEIMDCYNRIWDLLDAEPKKTFPNLDQLCPLPTQFGKMTRS